MAGGGADGVCLRAEGLGQLWRGGVFVEHQFPRAGSGGDGGATEGAGIAVKVEETVHPNGRFAHLRDPDGNRIELWEPGGTDLVRPVG